MCCQELFFLFRYLHVVAQHLLVCLCKDNPPKLIGLGQSSQTGRQTALIELAGFRLTNQANKHNIRAEI